MRRPPGTRGLFRRQVGTDIDVALWTAAVVANGGTVSAERALLVTSLIASWKAAGVWGLMDDAWLLTAENAPQALTSLKQRRLATAVNSPTFTADQGYAFDGATNYIDTGFVPSTMAVAMSNTNGRMSTYERTNTASNTQHGSTSSGASFIFRPRNAASAGLSGVLSSATANFTLSPADSRGLLSTSLTGTTALMYQRGVRLTDVTGVTVRNLPNQSLYLGANNATGVASNFRGATLGFAAATAQYSDAQEVADNTAVQAFMTSIGANV